MIKKTRRSGVMVGWLVHDVSHESIKGRDPALLLTVPEDLAAVDIEGGEVGRRPASRVLVFDLHGRRRLGRQGTMATHTLQVEDPNHLLGEVRIAREDRTAVLPGPDRIFVEPGAIRRWSLILATHPECRASWATSHRR